jgi:hypothetical protein
LATATLNNLGIGNILKAFTQKKQGQQAFQHTINFDDLHLTFFWNNASPTTELDDLSLVT